MVETCENHKLGSIFLKPLDIFSAFLLVHPTKLQQSTAFGAQSLKIILYFYSKETILVRNKKSRIVLENRAGIVVNSGADLC